MKRAFWFFGGLLILLGSGCFSGQYAARYDKFTGKTTKDGRIGWISTATETYAIHIHTVGTDRSIEVYALNQAPVTVDKVDLLADQQTRINLTCLFREEGAKGHITYRKFGCSLTPQQATSLMQVRMLELRVLGNVTTATAEQLATLAKALQ